MSRVRLAFGFLLAAVTAAHAQVVQTGLSRDTIRVGDPFRAVVRVIVPEGTEIVFPDSLPATEDVENSGKMRVKRDSAVGGSSVVAAYALTAWRPGALTLPDVRVVLKTANGERTLGIRLPAVHVVSVLPADTTGIQAKPPKDVLGGNRLWWPWLLAALLLLIALGLWYWWYRKRRREEPALDVIPTIMPRDRALHELDRIAQMDLLREGLYKRYYTLVAEVLRQYMTTVEPSWTGYLTTEELARKVRGRSEITGAIAVLRNADMVKFAKQTPSQSEASRDLDRTRDFITDYPPPPAIETAPAEGAAA
ncbi:MAG TPA: hypothetical protein VF021_08460 [Longimicrobiales bacterium]